MKTNGNKRFILILIFAFILRITLFFIAQPWKIEIEQNRIVRSDAIGYHALAKSIVNDFSFELNGQKNSFRTPAYPAFLALIYFIFGSKPYLVLIFQIIINVFSIVIVYKIAKHLFNEKLALISSFLYSIDPHTILYTCELFTETIFTFIILLAFFYFVKALQAKKLIYFALTALYFGISALVRPISQLIPILLVFLLFIHTDFDFSFKLKSSIIIISVFFLTVSPWMYRNYTNFSAVSLSSLPSYNLVFYNIAFTEFSKSGKSLKKIRKELSLKAKEKGASFSHWTTDDAKTFKNTHAYQEVSKKYIKTNFYIFSVTHLKNSFLVFLNVGTKGIMSMLGLKEVELPNMAAAGLFENIVNIIKLKSSFELLLIFLIAVFFLIMYGLTLIGITILFQQKKYFSLILVLGFILYYAFILGANGNAARFKLPIIPFYSLFASVGLVQIGKYVKSKREKLS